MRAGNGRTRSRLTARGMRGFRFLGVLAGVTLGFLYYYFVENKGDSFAFTNEAYSSMFFGAVLGYFVTGSPCARFGR